MIQFFNLIFGLAGDVYAELFEGSAVGHGKDDRGVSLTVLKLVELVHSKRSLLGRNRADRKGDKHFIDVQAGIMIAKVVDLQVLNGLDDRG